ncbi:MAG: ABC-F family ATP-binding cassette domain-containing protein [Acidobacteriota bacterium]|nr:ABC-F family ATP-binding cassette domain-containing protein [Acidobacteriota bacterium]MDQ7086972.1 ABC-F family ATP-binding cassette domain-containing protein [Acidobacteriota bacterium]
MLSLAAISRSVGGRTLFEDVSWTIHPGDRIGLVGPNGCGKTTLLRIIAGVDEPDRGRIRRRRGLHVAYLPQEVEAELHPRTSVLEAALSGADHVRELGREIEALAERMAELDARGDAAALAEVAATYGERRSLFEWFGGDGLEARARVVLGGLGFSREACDAPVGTLSGGWRMRVLMARMLLSGADLLLLDEPTNHLDLDALAWLEAHLGASPAAVVVVSHDRIFLDRVVERIADLVAGRLRVTRGDYSAWVRRRRAEREQLEARDRQLAAEEDRLRRFVERFGAKATKASQASDRKRRLEEVRGQRRALVFDPAWSWSFSWPPPPPGPDLLLSLEKAAFGFDGRPVLEGVDLHLRRGDRLAVLGANGAGKTTLLRGLAGDLFPLAGRREVARGLLVARFHQHQLEAMDPAASVFEQAGRTAPGRTPEQVRRALGTLGLGEEHISRPVSSLSGGERARLALARLLLEPCHLLMLDEPTNHLDLPLREALEQALEAWPGTLIVVSHDRVFLERLTRESLVVEGGRVERLEGGWRQWLARRSAVAAAGVESPGARVGRASAHHRSRAGRRARAEALQARRRRLRPLQEEVARLEDEVHAAEQRLAEIDAGLADPAVHADGPRLGLLAAERGEVARRLEVLTAAWAEKAEQLEAAENEAAD